MFKDFDKALNELRQIKQTGVHSGPQNNEKISQLVWSSVKRGLSFRDQVSFSHQTLYQERKLLVRVHYIKLLIAQRFCVAILIAIISRLILNGSFWIVHQDDFNCCLLGMSILMISTALFISILPQSAWYQNSRFTQEFWDCLATLYGQYQSSYVKELTKLQKRGNSSRDSIQQLIEYQFDAAHEKFKTSIKKSEGYIPLWEWFGLGGFMVFMIAMPALEMI